MAFLEIAHAPAAQTEATSLLHRLVTWAAHRRAERQRYHTLQSLLFMPEHRLDDMGISRDDVLTALARHR